MDRFEDFYIVRVPRDGNCLFSSLTTQLLSTRYWCSEHVEFTKCLRKDACKYIQENLEMYRVSIIESAREKWPELSDEDQLINLFLNDLSLDGTWGGEEILQATSSIYNIRIEVYQIGIPPIVLEYFILIIIIMRVYTIQTFLIPLRFIVQ